MYFSYSYSSSYIAIIDITSKFQFFSPSPSLFSLSFLPTFASHPRPFTHPPPLSSPDMTRFTCTFPPPIPQLSPFTLFWGCDDFVECQFTDVTPTEEDVIVELYKVQ